MIMSQATLPPIHICRTKVGITLKPATGTEILTATDFVSRGRVADVLLYLKHATPSEIPPAHCRSDNCIYMNEQASQGKYKADHNNGQADDV